VARRRPEVVVERVGAVTAVVGRPGRRKRWETTHRATTMRGVSMQVWGPERAKVKGPCSTLRVRTYMNAA